MKLSVIVPCHNEAENVAALHERLTAVLKDGPEWELIFVDDGSTDDTLNRLRALRERDPRVNWVRLLVNAGQQAALLAGLHRCHSEMAVTMDADLQHPPETIPALLETQKRTGAWVVAARRIGRQQGVFKNLFSRLFYAAFGLLTGVPIRPGSSDFRLYTRAALDLLVSIRENAPFLRGMVEHLRLPIAEVEYTPEPRHAGSPSYTFFRSARLAARAVLRFSQLPARIGLALGCLGILLSVTQACHYFCLRVFTDKLVPGQADLMVTLGLVAGVILVLLSVICLSVMRILDYVRGRPAYIVEEEGLAEVRASERPCTGGSTVSET